MIKIIIILLMFIIPSNSFSYTIPELNITSQSIFCENVVSNMQSIKDLLDNIYQDGYRNNFGLVCHNGNDISNCRIIIHNLEDANLISFLSYIADINLYPMIEQYYNQDPLMSSLKELYHLYKDKEICYNIYSFWIIYNSYKIILRKLNIPSIQADILLNYDDNEDEYMLSNPNTMYTLDLKLKKLAEQQLDLIKGAIKNYNITTETNCN